MESMPNLSQSVPLDTFVMLAMYAVIAILAIYTAVFYYHWKSYGTNTKVTNLTLLAYALTTIPLAISIVSLALLY